MMMGHEEFIESDYSEHRYCYKGYNYTADSIKLGRCKSKFKTFNDLDIKKRSVLLNDLIIIKNVFDVNCIVRSFLSDLDRELWPLFITTMHNITLIPESITLNNEKIELKKYRNDSLMLEYTK